MTEKVTLALIDEEPTFILENGTIIDTNLVGYISKSFGGHTENSFFDKITKEDIRFIMDNDVECEIEMMDEFTNPDMFEDIPMFESERTPKLYKGKIIIHLK